MRHVKTIRHLPVESRCAELLNDPDFIKELEGQLPLFVTVQTVFLIILASNGQRGLGGTGAA